MSVCGYKDYLKFNHMAVEFGGGGLCEGYTHINTHL